MGLYKYQRIVQLGHSDFDSFGESDGEAMYLSQDPELDLIHICMALLDGTNDDCHDHQILMSESLVSCAKYNTIGLNEKNGALCVFDSAVSKLLEKTGQSSTWIERTENERLSLNLDLDYDVRTTGFIDLLMIVGEQGKRIPLSTA